MMRCEDNLLLEQSRMIKQKAKTLLDKLELKRVLERYGEVEIIGSYALDVMWDRDIDIIVRCEESFESAKSALVDLITSRLVQKYEFGDFEKFPREKRPKAHIVNLQTQFEGEKWEIEIWFFSIELFEEQKAKCKGLKERLKPFKLDILKQKQERVHQGATKHEKSSMEIYEDVMR